MPTNRLDTVTMYATFHTDILNLFKGHWQWDNSDNEMHLHHWHSKTRHCYVRYFPDMWNRKRLYVTFSMPKLYNNSNSNTHPVMNFDTNIFMRRLFDELSKVIDVSIIPNSLKSWFPSRTDLFHMIQIDPLDSKEIHRAYGRLMYRGVQAHTYMNTVYLHSASKNPSVLLRSYNKSVEIRDRRSMLAGILPPALEDYHEDMMMCAEYPYELYRIEFLLRRDAIKRYLGKMNLASDMLTMMDEGVQKHLMNTLIKARDMDLDILSRRTYQQVARAVAPTPKTEKNALGIASSIRNHKKPQFTAGQIRNVKKMMAQYGVSVVTADSINIRGISIK